MAEEEEYSMALKVRSVSVKPIKDALEKCRLFDKRKKITPCPTDDGYFNVPFKLSRSFGLIAEDGQDENSVYRLLSSLGVEQHLENVSFLPGSSLDCQEFETGLNHPMSRTVGSNAKVSNFEAAVDEWLKYLPTSARTRWKDMKSSGKKVGYTLYHPMLLLSPASFSKYLSDDELSKHLSHLYECLSKRCNITHIAINAPIPAKYATESAKASQNTMRSPSGLLPLYGDFGPALPALHVPSSEDFESAFWCSTMQNGIYQTWAPRYSMFSKGNISEKTRILHLAQKRSFSSSPDTSEIIYTAELSSAVDLYAGIGYFAFSYAKAGLSQVLCWEINPWSVEALRRGALRNQWKVMIVRDDEENDILSQKVHEERPRLLVFEESNERASERIKALLCRQPLLHSIAPLRHVNCGYLPSSEDSWKTAVDILDTYAGGWIHVHENIGQSDIKDRKVEIVHAIQRLADGKVALASEANRGRSYSVWCEHLEHVKSYAPGVIHCVLDVFIQATCSNAQ